MFSILKKEKLPNKYLIFLTWIFLLCISTGIYFVLANGLRSADTEEDIVSWFWLIGSFSIPKMWLYMAGLYAINLFYAGYMISLVKNKPINMLFNEIVLAAFFIFLIPFNIFGMLEARIDLNSNLLPVLRQEYNYMTEDSIAKEINYIETSPTFYKLKTDYSQFLYQETMKKIWTIDFISSVMAVLMFWIINKKEQKA